MRLRTLLQLPGQLSIENLILVAASKMKINCSCKRACTSVIFDIFSVHNINTLGDEKCKKCDKRTLE